MSLKADQRVELSIEKPAAGGRMIARHDGQIVLVQGAIPGERVIAHIQRVERQLAFGETVDIIDRSPDREATDRDLACGGCLYAHVAYPRQLTLKADVIHDAFHRLGRIPLDTKPEVRPSATHGYRMRARLHVKGDRVGFYREGTHDLCDARSTGQLTEAAVDAAQRAVDVLAARGCAVAALELTENIAASERVLQFASAGDSAFTNDALDAVVQDAGVTGCTVRTGAGTVLTAGVPVVADPLDVLTGGAAQSGSLSRHGESFFQANRFLLPALVTAVLESIPADGDVLDLYAGVGLFSVSLAASGRQHITAVEGDRTSGSDLQRNANPYARSLRVRIDSVEDYLKRHAPASRRRVATIVVDPPRTGMSRQAIGTIIERAARRIVYVSCDPPTLARDARRLLDSGYGLTSLDAFDLFPNTPHVETVGVFDRA
jgi:23S rRNA (uracil1939-C5)-methyltransferase